MLVKQAQIADRILSEFAGDPDFQELLDEFAAAIPERKEGLLSAHTEQAYDALRVRAHQLKGAGGGYGFPRLSELAAELERACQTREPVGIATALAPVIDYLNRIAI